MKTAMTSEQQVGREIPMQLILERRRGMAHRGPKPSCRLIETDWDRSPKYRTTRAWKFALLMLLGSLSLMAPDVHAETYTLTIIADTDPNGPFSDLGYPTVNDSGQVAFSATLRPSSGFPAGGSGVYRSEGMPLSPIPIYEDTELRAPFDFGGPAIDNAGRVFFQPDSLSVKVGSGGPISLVIDASTTIPFGDNTSPTGEPIGPLTCMPTLWARSVTGAGDVLIKCSVWDNSSSLNLGFGVYFAGSSLERVCDTGPGWSLNQNFYFDYCFDPNGWPEVNPGGFIGGLGFELLTFQSMLLRYGVSVPEVLLNLSSGTDVWPTSASSFALALDGSLAYTALRTTTPVGTGLYKLSIPDQPVAIVDPFVYPNVGTVSVNGFGDLAFTAYYLNALGLFNGPDPVADKVIGFGDSLPGYQARISWIDFEHPGVNNAGQIVFLAHLADGLRVIVRADPPANEAPSLNNPGDQTTPEGLDISLQLTANDPDGDTLTFGLGPPPSALPEGTTAGLPPGLTLDFQTGEITGAITPGNAGNAFLVTVTVSDGRGGADIETFTWTVTEPVPEARTGLTATPNVPGNSIVLAWSNPALDIATQIEVRAAFAGDPLQRVAVLPAGTTRYEFFAAQSGQAFCFAVFGRSASGGLSPSSNVRCATYPLLQISGLEVLATATTATVTWQTNMPASGLVVYAVAGGSFGPPLSSQSDAAGTSHTATISGLSPNTSYTVRVVAQSLQCCGLAEADKDFRTALPGMGNGPILDVQRVTYLEPFTSVMEMTVRVSNDARAPAAATDVLVSVATTLEWRCPPVSGQCFSDTIVENLILPVPIGTLAPGNSREVALRFLFPSGLILRSGGPAVLHAVVSYGYTDGGNTFSDTFTRDIRTFLPGGSVIPPAVGIDLAVEELQVLVSRTLTGGFDVSITFDIANLGFEEARTATARVSLPDSVLLASNVNYTFQAPLPPGVQCRQTGWSGSAQNPDRPAGAPSGVSCTISNLAAGEHRVIQFHTRTTCRGGGNVVAGVSGSGPVDLNPDNDEASQVVPACF